MTTVALLLFLLGIGLGVLIVQHDANLDAHRARASKQITDDAAQYAEFSRILEAHSNELHQIKSLVNDMRVVLLALIPRYPNQPSSLSVQE